MANGNLVISDFNNRCVKLLDQAYNVIGQEELPTYPRSICSISPDEIAVTMRDEIHFLRVDTEKIITIKHIQLNHSCYGIATHKGDMFVTSGTALLQYTTDGRLVKKLYEDTSSNYLVVGVAVSPDGKRIYLTDKENSRLVTLAMDGAVTATLQDPAFKHSRLTGNIHVAATGHVFVFGNKYVSQVDTDVNTILATVDVDCCPRAVYFNVDRSKLLVGIEHDNMIEFKTKIS